MDIGIRLLMVEDVAEEAVLASRHLQRAGIGHQLHRVETEEELRRELIDFNPALILSDFTLPGFDGMSALRVARELKPETPFLFFSGTIGEERAIEALKSGAVDYVLKGNMRRLASAVNRALAENAEHQARREAEQALRESEERLKRLNRVHAMLSDTNSVILRIRDRDSLLREACRIAVTHGQYAVAWAGMLDEAGTALTKVAASGRCPQLFGDGPFPLEMGSRGPENLLMRALRTKQRAMIESGYQTAGQTAGPLRMELAKNGLEGAIALPLFVGDKAVGVFALAAARSQLCEPGEIKLLEELAGDLSYALQYIRQEARLRYLANYDSLTGLANRELLCVWLQQLIDSATPERLCAVTLFDVEHLSGINTMIGRHHGDEILRQMAARLRRHSPDGGRIAHLGGGVFATVFDDLRSEAESFGLQEWYERHVMSEPLRVNGHNLRIAGHLGIALYPMDGSDASALLASAEVALRNAKGAGERVMYSSPLLNARVGRRLSLEGRLRTALEKEQFSLHLQPKVRLDSGEIVGFEALLRWFDPEHEVLAPDVFVPILEEMGLIEAVGQWVLHRASVLSSDWRLGGKTGARIAVNLSARQLARADFARQVQACLDPRTAENPGIDFELTESALLADVDGSVERLHALREMGFGIAIDDFGTGYSSLNQLVRLPVDTLKVDKSFIQRMTTDRNVRTVVATIASLAHSLQLNTVAEGVETQEQLRQLKELGCMEYQGFLFSPPVSVTAATEMLNSPKTRVQ